MVLNISRQVVRFPEIHLDIYFPITYVILEYEKELNIHNSQSKPLVVVLARHGISAILGYHN
jgi:hypothetical protein